jgi:ribosomal protein L11 methyltransferase
MRYIEITANVCPEQAEAACDALRALAEGAWIETPFVQPDLESDAQRVRDVSVRVHVYVTSENAPDAAIAGRNALAAAGIDAPISTCAVDEEDWAESWKEHFHVERFGARVVIVPSWRAFVPAPDDVVVTLDPGMAFGTGQHETTRTCIEALERAVAPGARVLDVGSGSGILSIVAAKLGAARVAACDVDENCARVTADNARLNGVDDRVEARAGSAGDSWPFDEPAAGFDVVVANIVARVIIDLAEPLVSALAGAGTLIVSGIIAEREPEVRAALEAAGARIASVRAMGEWRCIEAVRA